MDNSKQEVGHTPGPWELDANTEELPFRVYSKTTQGNIAYTHCEANAAFIVRACNAHEQLVAALRKIARINPGSVADERAAEGDWTHFREPESVQIARDALAAAKA